MLHTRFSPVADRTSAEFAADIIADRDRAAVLSARRARHICILFHDFPAGGSERIMIRLANAWAERGRRVTILCGSEAGPARSRVDERVAVIETRPAVPRGVGSRRRFGRAAAALLPALAPDIVIGPGNFHLPVLHAIGSCQSPLLCKLSNALERPGRGRFGRALMRWKLRRASRRLAAVVAISPALAREAGDMAGLARVLELPQPNFDDEQPLPVPRCTAGSPRILCAGRLVRQKRLALALDAFAALPDSGATLTIAGDGPERRRLEGHARRLGIEQRVRFLGHVGDIGPLLAATDLLLSTSAFEGYPAVLVEALAAGVPVVTTRSSPAIPEIVDHPSFGRIADARPEAIARAMMEAVRGPAPDRARIAALIDGHRIGRSAEAWLAALDTIVVAHARSA